MIHVDEYDPVGEIDLSFPYRDVIIKRGIDAKETYDMVQEVGRGKFGTVYKCKEKSTGLQLAAKYVPIPKRDDRRNVEREVEIMNSLQHSLIIQLYDAFEHQKMMCVVLELIEGGELFDRVIDDDFVLTEKACSVFIRQVCQGMEFIHRNNILHLDLKPENILCLTREGNRIKIIDFGLARKYDPDKKLQVLFGTPEFVAPEVVNFDSISFGTDMWSVGVICYVLVSGLSPFMGSTDIETMANVTIGKYDFDDEAFSSVSQDALDFIRKLLVKDSSARMTATECIEHIWLKRRPKPPQLASKPIIVPPPKFKTPPPPSKAQQDEELKTTKDNLKSFIERWEEHPNSPYIFDATDSNRISPAMLLLGDDDEAMKTMDRRNNGSGLSSRAGCSPSPCGSISSEMPLNEIDLKSEMTDTTDGSSVNPNDYSSHAEQINRENNKNLIKSNSNSQRFAEQIQQHNNSNNHLSSNSNLLNGDDVDDDHKKQFKEYLQSFDRRNSDSNCPSTCEKMNLAAEIKKLSERLMMLSSINNDLNDFNEQVNSEDKSNGDKLVEKKLLVPPSSTKTKPAIKEKPTDLLKTKTKKTQISSDNRSVSQTSSAKSTTISTKSSSKSVSTSSFSRTSSSESSNFSSFSSTSKQLNGLSEHLKTLDETPNLYQRFDDTRTMSKSIDIKQSNSRRRSPSSSPPINNLSSAPWPITNKRTKFRVTQMSRDVPIGSPNTHQTVFLEEAVNTTKDCLLHLLEKYNESETRAAYSSKGRHQSIAVGYGISDNFEYRSMNSLNHFFQRHATDGTTVKQIQAQIESKRK